MNNHFDFLRFFELSGVRLMISLRLSKRVTIHEAIFLSFFCLSFICKYVKCFLNKIKYWKSYLKPEIYIFCCLFVSCVWREIFCFVAFSCSQIYVDYFRGFFVWKGFLRSTMALIEKRIWREIFAFKALWLFRKRIKLALKIIFSIKISCRLWKMIFKPKSSELGFEKLLSHQNDYYDLLKGNVYLIMQAFPQKIPLNHKSQPKNVKIILW